MVTLSPYDWQLPGDLPMMTVQRRADGSWDEAGLSDTLTVRRAWLFRRVRVDLRGKGPATLVSEDDSGPGHPPLFAWPSALDAAPRALLDDGVRPRLEALARLSQPVGEADLEEMRRASDEALQNVAPGVLGIGPRGLSRAEREVHVIGYGYGLVTPRVDWVAWHRTPRADALFNDRGAMDGATIDELACVMTTLLRLNRFADGTLASYLRAGLHTRVARRATAILDAMDRGIPQVSELFGLVDLTARSGEASRAD